jgi:hypothetical protein
MQTALDSDQHAFDHGQPTFARLRFMKELNAAVANRFILRALMRSNFLNVCGAFISPYKTKSGEGKFPTRTLVKDMLTLLDKLDVNSDDLEMASRSDGIINLLTELPDYGQDISLLRRSLIRKWQRTVVCDDLDSDVDSEEDTKGKPRRKVKPLFDKEALKQERKDLSTEQHMGITQRLDAKLDKMIKQKALRKAAGVLPPQDFKPPPRFLETPKIHPKRKPGQ